MQYKHLSLNSVEVKFDPESGRKFSGYASVFGGVDSYGDTIEKGAYIKTLTNRTRPVQMRWNHFGPIIGKWTNIQEDEKGLYVEGELTPNHSVANDVAALMMHKAIDGLSIGYFATDYEQDGAVRRLKEIQLFEISVVEEPADINARVGNIKSAIHEATSLKELETLLRDAGGLSKADATALVSRIKSLSLGDPDQKLTGIKNDIIQLINRI